MKIRTTDPKWVGEKFADLTVIGLAGKDKHNRQLWKCKCVCGNEIDVLPTYLFRGEVKSCGCLRSRKPWRKYENGYGAGSRIYRIWAAMKTRATNPNHPEANSYHNRGIDICEEWKNSYPAFLNWALQNGYTDDLSIDRIDVNGDYCPENCRWATTKEQSVNRRNTVYWEKDGEKIPIFVYCEERGLNYRTVKSRIRSGWDIERALTEPTFDKEKSLRKAANEAGMKYQTVYHRVKKLHMTLEEALTTPVNKRYSQKSQKTKGK